MNKMKGYSPEVRERAARLVFEHQGEHESQWAAIASIASKIGCTPETLRKWVRQAETDQGVRSGASSSDRERLKQLEQGNRELKGMDGLVQQPQAARAIGNVPPAEFEMEYYRQMEEPAEVA